MSGFSWRRMLGLEQDREQAGPRRQPERTGPAQEQERGGLLGWADRAGDWIGDTWDGATETVGGWVDDAQTWVGDIADVVTSSDVDWGGLLEGRLDVQTDLDEVADLLPERLASQFQLDREGSDNLVDISMDRNAGTITLRSSQIALSCLDLDAIQAGATDLRDLEIVLTDPDGQLAFDGLTDLEGYDIQVKVGGADVTSLVLRDGDGAPTTAIDSAALTDLSFAGRRDADGLAAEVGLGSAEVRGLSGSTTADALALSDVAGSLSSDGETGRLDVGSVRADGLATDAGSGSFALDGLSATIANQGGGLPFLDDKADALKAAVQLDAGRVTDLDTASADLGYLELAAAAFDYDQAAGTVDGTLGSGRVEGLTGPADVRSAAVGGVAFDLTEGERLGLDIDRLRADGIDLSGGGGGAGGGTSGPGMAIDARVGDAAITDLSLPGGVHLAGVTSSDVDVRKDASGVRASADAARADGVTAGDMSIASASGADVAFAKIGDRLDLEAGAIDASGFTHGDVAVGSASVRGADIQVDPGALDASADSARLEAARFRDLSADVLQIDGVSVDRDRASGALDAQLGGALATGFRKGSDVAVDRADIGATGIQVTPGAEGSTIGVASERVQVAGLDTAKQDVGDLDLQGVDFTMAQGRGDVSVDRVAATDFSSGTFQAGGLTANAADATFGQGGFRADIADAGVTDWSAGNIGAGSSTVEGVSVAGGEGALDLSVDRGQTSGLRAGGATVDEVRFADLDLTNRRDQDRLTELGIGSAEVEGVSAGDATIAAGSVSGLDLRKQGGPGGPLDLGIDQAGVTGVRVDGDGHQVQIGAVDAAGLDLSTGPDGLDVGLDSLGASDVAVRTQGGSGGGGGSDAGGPGIDAQALIRSGSALIDDVDLSAQIGLNGGELAGGLAEVEHGTVADARIVVEDGEITSDTAVELSQAIDGPLWTTGRGAYVTDNGKLKADIGGFFDINAAGRINDAVGVDGNRLASIEAYGAAVADGMDTPSASQTQPDGPGLVDPSTLAVQGDVALNAGRLDAGIGGVTLEERTALEVDVGNGTAAARIERLNTAAIAVAMGDTELDVDDADLDEVRVLLDQNGGDLEATLEQIRLEGIRFSRD